MDCQKRLNKSELTGNGKMCTSHLIGRSNLAISDYQTIVPILLTIVVRDFINVIVNGKKRLQDMVSVNNMQRW